MVLIPQAVSTIAIEYNICTWYRYSRGVSIPQAVGDIAILMAVNYMPLMMKCFNTASGKCYCNFTFELKGKAKIPVSIPQAVSAIAIQCEALTKGKSAKFKGCFNTASGKCYCNVWFYFLT